MNNIQNRTTILKELGKAHIDFRKAKTPEAKREAQRAIAYWTYQDNKKVRDAVRFIDGRG